MIAYITLKFIWWCIISALIIIFAITGGMDIGVNCLLPIIGKNDNDRRLILNSIGPTWEGNQVWLITLGAGLFAIWPIVYATIFSGMYFAFMLVLLMLILRPPGFDYRNKIDSKVWRNTWDLCLFVGSVILALAFGLVIGNLFVGMSFYFDNDLREIYTGSFLDILSPCSIIFAILSICAMGLQGALFLQYKLPDRLKNHSKIITIRLGFGFIISFICAVAYVALVKNGYQIVSIGDLNSKLVVTNKVVQEVPGWFNNYMTYKGLWCLPICSIVAAFLAVKFSNKDQPLKALFMNSIGISTCLLTFACALFPFIMPSTYMPNHSLTIWDVSSSELTLLWSLVAIAVFLPLILLYTGWAYRVMRGEVKISKDSY